MEPLESQQARCLTHVITRAGMGQGRPQVPAQERGRPAPAQPAGNGLPAFLTPGFKGCFKCGNSSHSYPDCAIFQAMPHGEQVRRPPALLGCHWLAAQQATQRPSLRSAALGRPAGPA